jgi:hypothetical protein
MAVLTSHPHTRQPVPIDREQERAVSLHPEGGYGGFIWDHRGGFIWTHLEIS